MVLNQQCKLCTSISHIGSKMFSLQYYRSCVEGKGGGGGGGGR